MEIMPTIVENYAREAMRAAMRLPPMISGGIWSGEHVSGFGHSVNFMPDRSVLVWSRYDGYIVIDAGTGCRDTIEHLARCLGRFTQVERAAMLKGTSQWIDGIHWDSDGSFISF